jgi:hypothetical protein
MWSDAGAACGRVSPDRDEMRCGGDRDANRQVCDDACRALPHVEHVHPSPTATSFRRRRSSPAVLSLAFAGVISCSEFLFPEMFTGEYVANVSIRYNGNWVSRQFNLSLFGTARVFANTKAIR